MKILHLSPLVPSLGGNGGRRAVLNHLCDLLEHKHEVDLVMVDVEGKGDALPDGHAVTRSVVFARGLPQGRGIHGVLVALRQFFLDPRPRAAAVVESREARLTISRWLRERDYALILVDHLNAWSLLNGIETNIPIYYVAHNVEADVLRDQLAQLHRLSIRRLRLALELRKMVAFEDRLLLRADSVIAISASDAKSDALRSVAGKVTCWPELPQVRAGTRSPATRPTLLFVGSAGYFPNRDAIDWLIRRFLPVLLESLPNAVLRIAGTSQADLELETLPPGLVLEGFVSVERLDELHRESHLFICPVVLGSGVKIKVLEASAYGLPIVATAESLEGIEYLGGASEQIDRNPQAAAQLVAGLLCKPTQLEALSVRALKQLNAAIRARPPLVAVSSATRPLRETGGNAE